MTGRLSKPSAELSMAQQRTAGQLDLRSDVGEAKEMVREQALEQLLASGSDVHGIATNREISNVISFNDKGSSDSVYNDEVLALRARVDEWVTWRLLDTFEAPYPLEVSCSGHFWYPPGGYMGWHTNSAAPGWRIYITHAREPGKSFFRYREPDTGRIVTAMDNSWDVRVFRIDPIFRYGTRCILIPTGLAWATSCGENAGTNR